MRNTEECLHLIKERLTQRATQQGGLDITDYNWSREMAGVIAYELRKEYAPKLNSEQRETMTLYGQYGYGLINDFTYPYRTKSTTTNNARN